MSASDNNVPAKPSFSYSKSPQFRDIYSNTFRYKIGYGDFALTFSNIADMADGTSNIEDQALVVITWAQLKMLAQTLAETVAGIEEETGSTIRTPANAGFDSESNLKMRAALIVRSLKFE